MNLKRMLVIAVSLTISWSTIASADLFTTEEKEESLPMVETNAAGTQQAQTDVSPQNSPYQAPLLTTGPGFDLTLGSKKGYIHPFLSVGGYYTDNLFNTGENEESDWVSVISPGIWVALPSSQQQMVQVTTENSAPGGLEVSRFRDRTGRRFQSYALYRAEINELSDNSGRNHVNQRGEALFKYNLNRFSLELLDIYQIGHDDYNSGDSGPESLDKYHSNLLSTAVSLQLTSKLRFEGEYSNFMLDYNSDSNDDSNRDDNTYSLYAFYKLSPKLTTFLQYEYVDTEYDTDARTDFTENNFYGGLQWDVTAKTKGRIRLGYGERDYDDTSLDKSDEFLVELRTDYRITPKTSIYLRALRKDYATDVTGTNDVLTQRFYLGYTQRIREKLHARARLEYRVDDYDGEITVGSATAEREDDYLGFRFELGYSLQRWLNVSVGYAYRERDSNFNDRDYTSNSVFVYLTAAM